jgi:hypothetical protein
MASTLLANASITLSCFAITSIYFFSNRREARYFNPYVERYKGESLEDVRKYCRQNYDRMEPLNAGNWCFIGIRADAEVVIGDLLEEQGTKAFSSSAPCVLIGSK